MRSTRRRTPFRPRRRAPRRFGARRLARRVSGLLTALLGLSLVLGGLLWLRLAQGPVELSALVWPEGPRVVALGGARLEVESLAFGLGDRDDPRPGVRLQGLTLRDAGGETLFEADAARLDVSLAALAAGRARPAAIALIRPQARLVRLRDGRFRLGIGEAPPDPGGRARALTAGGRLAALLEAEEGPLGDLRRVEMVNADLVYEDRVADRVWVAERADLEIERDAAGDLRAVGRLTLPEGALGPTLVRIEGRREEEGGAAFALSFTGLAPADLADQFAELDALRALDAPLQGRASVEIDGDGRLLSLAARLRAAPGRLRALEREAALRSAALSLSYAVETGRYLVEELSLEAEPGAVSASGFIDLERDAEGAPAQAVAALTLERLELAAPGVLPEPAVFDGGRLVARATLDPLRIELGELTLRRGAATLSASGEAAQGPGGWSGEARLSAAALEIPALLALWPETVAAGARAWMAANVEAGRVDEAHAFLRVGDGALDALAADFAFSEGRTRYLKGLPPLEAVRGWGEVTRERLALTVESARTTAPGGETLRVAEGLFAIDDLRARPPVAEVRLRAEAPLSPLLALLDLDPLNLPSKGGLSPDDVSGRAVAEAALTLPLVSGLRFDAVGVAVEGTAYDLDARPPQLDRRIQAAAMAVRADAETLRLEGDARVEGVPLDLSATVSFNPPPGAPQAEAEVAGRPTPEQLAALGLDLRDYFRGGRATVRAELAAIGGGRTRFDATLGLEDAALAAPPLEWRKPPGAAARGRVRGVSGPQALRLDRFSLDAPGLELAGAASFGPARRARRVDLDRLAYQGLVEAALEATRRGRGWEARLRGDRLDARAIEGLLEGGGGGARTPLDLDLRLDRLDLARQVSLAPATVRVSVSSTGEVSGAFEGRVGGVGAASGALGGRVGAVALTLRSGEAGDVLRGLDLLPGGIGGRLRLDATLREGGALDGRAVIEDMVVSRDDAFDQLLDEAELQDLRASLRDEGLLFERIVAPFRLDADRLRLDGAVAHGPAVGLTAEGVYDFDADRLDIAGEFTPAYAVNSAIGAIPIIGDLLTGGEGRGVFAVNYRLSGPAEAPRISVNPLSALAPGVFRRILQAAEGAGREE